MMMLTGFDSGFVCFFFSVVLQYHIITIDFFKEFPVSKAIFLSASVTFGPTGYQAVLVKTFKLLLLQKM